MDDTGLEELLLQLGGYKIDQRWRPEWDVRIVNEGREDIVSEPSSRRYSGLQPELAAAYYIRYRLKRGRRLNLKVGYGLLGDGVWRRHMWSTREITHTLRQRYFGILLTRPEIMDWYQKIAPSLVTL